MKLFYTRLRFLQKQLWIFVKYTWHTFVVIKIISKR